MSAFPIFSTQPSMTQKIRTEADRKASPKPVPMSGYSLPKMGGGQKISLERGTATRSKKNPGKRARKGG
ncbi:hypothetical protein GCM10023165_55960 [Variovorax defluvii]|uniref:Uncharacterized protein n=2 Tax=Variovorax defluvii TaxID=913761 RepID=A0ABP8IIQ1_9BURK